MGAKVSTSCTPCLRKTFFSRSRPQHQPFQDQQQQEQQQEQEQGQQQDQQQQQRQQQQQQQQQQEQQEHHNQQQQQQQHLDHNWNRQSSDNMYSSAPSSSIAAAAAAAASMQQVASSAPSKQPAPAAASAHHQQHHQSSNGAGIATTRSGDERVLALDGSVEDEVFTDAQDTVEHISEREDFSRHEELLRNNVVPRNSPGLRRSLSVAQGTRRQSSSELVEADSLRSSRKFNSTSTLFIDSTVSAPDMEETLRCVGVALHMIICDGHTRERPNVYPQKFDEMRFPLTEHRVPADYASRIPTEEEIYIFLKKIFHAALLSAECGVITLVYINRALAYTDLTLHASNWKRVLLGAVLMASKVWDDQAVWNVDFCSIMPKVHVEDMNDIEMTYLEMLQFNINVESSVYTKYYFELRTLAEMNNRSFPLEPLSKERAAKLEAVSVSQEDRLKQEGLMRNAKSLDARTFTARAILN